MSAFNSPFALDPTKQQLRMLLPPKQRAEFDKLQADAARGKRGLARLNPQPPTKMVLNPNVSADDDRVLVERAIDSIEAEELESLHDAVVDVLLMEQAENEGMISREEAA